MGVSRNMSLADRLAFYSTPGPNGCVHWTGNHSDKGYAKLDWKGRSRRAHRLAWEAANGPIPPGLCVLHRCDNPGCVNIEHLWLGTQLENIADREAKNRRGAMPDNAGSRNGMARLSEQQVREIRASPERQYVLAERYGISQGAVSNICNQRSWKHILEN